MWRRKSGLIGAALASGWQFSAVVAAAILVLGVFVAPSVLAENRMLVGLAGPVRSVAWMAATGFLLLALSKLFNPVVRKTAARTAPREARRPPGASAESSGHNTALYDLDEACAAAGDRMEPRTIAKPTVWSPSVLEDMEWKRFEDVCCAFYRMKGIKAEVTPLGPDGGIDICLHQDAGDPTAVTAIVQCKAWSQAVGVKPVRELRGVMAHRRIEKAFFMAPFGFTDDARTFANANRITLLDAKLIHAMIHRLPPNDQSALLEKATQGDWTTPTCPKCGDRMVGRKGARGPFWGCLSYPRCRSTLQMRRPVAG